MLSLQGIEIDVCQVGRTDWPEGVAVFSPWITPRVLQHFELWFIWRGRGWVRQGETSTAIRAGELYWFQPHVQYVVDQDPADPLGVNYAGFDMLQNGELLRSTPPEWPRHIDEVEADLAESVTRRVVELYWQTYVDYKDHPEAERLSVRPYFKFLDDHYEHFQFAPLPINIFRPEEKVDQGAILAADALFRGLLIEIVHQSQRSDRRNTHSLDIYQRRLVSQIAMRIQKDPAAKISASKLAEECGYSPDYFTRLFKKVMNCSPQRYQVLARVNKACQQLRDSDLLIKQIASQLGYSNEYFFSRQFKSVTGQNPSDYRKAHTG